MVSIIPAFSDGQWLAAATAFELQWVSDDGGKQILNLVRRGRRPEAWAIELFGEVLGRTGEWEDEPQPSSRDEAFFARCRWASPADAAAFAQEHLGGTLTLLNAPMAN